MARITKEKYNDIKKELDTLCHQGRNDVAESLKKARAHGDLSENAEYDEARKMQGNLEMRIDILENRLKDAEIITSRTKNVEFVDTGCVVEIEVGKKKVSYEIVPTEDSDIMENKISDQSPIGLALIGKKVGESAHIVTPAGEKKELKVKSIK